MTTPIDITVWSDPVCPWCWIGERQLALALARPGVPADRVRITWRPFQLNPGLPHGGIARKDYLQAKFGDSAPSFYERIAEVARGLGLDVRFERIDVQPNTADAHRLIQHVQAVAPAATDALVQALFRAFFVEGRNIGDHTVLADCASTAGVELPDVASWLAGDAGRAAVADAQAEAARLGIHGVPQFIVAGRLMPPGAVSADSLATAVTMAGRA